MKTPYKLSKDYDRLYELVKDGNERNETPVFAGRCLNVMQENESSISDTSFIGMALHIPKDKDLFIQECQRLNVEYIEPASNIKEQFLALTDEGRMDIVRLCCKFCGSLDPDCQCWNDE